MHGSQRSRHAEKCTKPKPNKGSLNLIKLNLSVRSMTILTHACNKLEPQSAHFNKDQYTHFTTLLLVHLMRMPSTNTFIIFQMTLP